MDNQINNHRFDNDERNYTDKIFCEDNNSYLNELYGINSFDNDACKKCINNPKNNPNASGICHCALAAMNNVKY